MSRASTFSHCIFRASRRGDAALAAKGWAQSGASLDGEISADVAETKSYDGFYVVTFHGGGYIVLKFYGSGDLSEWTHISDAALSDDDFSNGDAATAEIDLGDNPPNFFKAKVEER